MKWRSFYWGATSGLCAVMLGACVGQHVAPLPLPAYCYSEQALTDAHKHCSTVSATRAESQACGVEVDRACGLTPVKGQGQ